MSRYFITGTDTDAGKTLVTAALLARARAQGLSTLGLKPVASGSHSTPEGLRNSDALSLQAQSYPPLEYAQINPFAFAPAIAPHLAAQQAGAELSVAGILQALEPTLASPPDVTLIEGAGGWRVPLNDREDLSDLPRALELPVILVVGLKLGCLNHARLTAEAIRADGLTLVGWVGTVIDPAFAADSALFDANMATLSRTLGASATTACLGVIPPLAESTEVLRIAKAAAYLNLPRQATSPSMESP